MGWCLWNPSVFVSWPLSKLDVSSPTEKEARLYLQVSAATVNSFGSMEFSREALEGMWPWAVRNYVCVSSNLYRPRLRPVQERAQKCLAEMQSRRESLSKLMWKRQWKYCGTCPRFCAETDKSHSRQFKGLPRWRSKETACQCRRLKRRGFSPWVGKILWGRVWQPTLIFLPGEFSWTEEPEGW